MVPPELALTCLFATSVLGKTVHLNEKRFTYTKMLTSASGPCDVSQGPDGLVWVQNLFANKLTRYNQHNGKLTEYDIPFTVPGFPATTLPLPGKAKLELFSCALRNGFDGYLYASNGAHNQLVQHNVTSGRTKVFTPPGLAQPLGNLQPLNDLTTAPDGVYNTMTAANKIARFDYHTHKMTLFDVPTKAAAPLGIYYASDGGIWFLEMAASKFARFDRKTHKIEEFQIPLAGVAPVVVRAETFDKNGDAHIWAACVLGGSVADINLRTKKITVHTEPGGPSNAVEDAQDYSDNVWISHILKTTLGVLNPRTGNFTEVAIPGSVATTPVGVPVFGGSGIFGKPVGEPTFGHKSTGNAMWFTKLITNQLVRLDLDGLVFP